MNHNIAFIGLGNMGGPMVVEFAESRLWADGV
jgi:3-hydroxyisobutyrate dehydrogenase-like beta-hydroxyacid dehydrogenase